MNREKEQWRHRIRHYGLFANCKHRAANIAHARQLLAVPAAGPSCSPSASCAVAPAGRAGIELADDAKITFTIALHGKYAWEMLVEDSHGYHRIRGWLSAIRARRSAASHS
jgi:hypothetical protein